MIDFWFFLIETDVAIGRNFGWSWDLLKDNKAIVNSILNLIGFPLDIWTAGLLWKHGYHDQNS